MRRILAIGALCLAPVLSQAESDTSDGEASCLLSSTITTNMRATTPVSRFNLTGLDTSTTANGGWVADRATNLMWLICPVGFDWEVTEGFGTCQWTGSEPAQAKTASEAQAAIDAANTATYLGYSNWRLPSIKELTSIVERACNNPTVNIRVFGSALASYSSRRYWSATVDATASGQMWIVDFDDGLTDSVAGTLSNMVRMVRSCTATECEAP